MRRRWQSAFFAVGLACLAAACHAAWTRAGGAPVPAPAALVAAATLLSCGLLSASRGWVTLLAGAAPQPEVVHGFMLSQLGKYIPGGVWLGVGQLGLAVAAGVPAPRAAGALGAFGVCFAVAAGTLAGAMAPVAGWDGSPYALVVLAGLGFPALLHRRWMNAAADRVARRIGASAGGAAVPSQARIVRAAGWSLASVASSAAGFAVLLSSVDPGTGVLDAAAAFSVAWLAGYLVLGLPSGIGAREAVLIAMLPAGAGPVLAASLAHRITQMAVEAVLAAAMRVLVARPFRRRTSLLRLEVPRA